MESKYKSKKEKKIWMERAAHLLAKKAYKDYVAEIDAFVFQEGEQYWYKWLYYNVQAIDEDLRMKAYEAYKQLLETHE